MAIGDLGYAHADVAGLGAAFAGFAARRWGWEVDPGAVVAVPDVLVAVAELLQALTAPGDRVVITPPVYPPFFSVTAETGRRAVEVPLGRGGCPSRASGRRSSPARVLLLCNPHNPTEQVSRREELVALAEIAAEHDHPAPDPLSAVLDVTMHDPMRLSRHARNEMRLYRISEQDVEATMSSPSSRELDDRGNARLGGETLDGRPILVVVARDVPDLVITVFLRS